MFKNHFHANYALLYVCFFCCFKNAYEKRSYPSFCFFSIWLHISLYFDFLPSFFLDFPVENILYQSQIGFRCLFKPTILCLCRRRRVLLYSFPAFFKYEEKMTTSMFFSSSPKFIVVWIWRMACFFPRQSSRCLLNISLKKLVLGNVFTSYRFLFIEGVCGNGQFYTLSFVFNLTKYQKAI